MQERQKTKKKKKKKKALNKTTLKHTHVLCGDVRLMGGCHWQWLSRHTDTFWRHSPDISFFLTVFKSVSFIHVIHSVGYISCHGRHCWLCYLSGGRTTCCATVRL